MDLRQTTGWAKYLQSIGWKIEKIGDTQIFIRIIPLLNLSLIKVQHQKNPLPLSKIDRVAKKYNSLATIIEPSLDYFSEKDIQKSGFRKTNQPLVHTSTIQIDLKPPLNSIYANFSENARRNIKKSQSFNLKVKTVSLKDSKDKSDFETFLRLLKNLTQIKKFWVPDDSEMRKKVAGLKDSSIFFAFENKSKEPIAADWIYFTKDSSHYIQTGIAKRGYEVLANYFLVWEIIKLSKKMKLKYFDFEGIFDPRYPKIHPRWKSFTDFKKRFHGTQIDYPSSYIKFYNTLFKWFYLLGTKLP